MICPHCAFPNEPKTRVCVKCHRPLDPSSKDDSSDKKTPGWFQAPVSKPGTLGVAQPSSKFEGKSAENKASATPMSEKVAACLKDAHAKEEGGDLRGAFLNCQSLLIDNYGDIPDDGMASLYIYMSRISAQQDKKERALKYLKKARTLAPKNPEIQELAEELTATPPTPIEQAVMQESARAAQANPSPGVSGVSQPSSQFEGQPSSQFEGAPAPVDKEMPTPDERIEPEFVIEEKISAPPPEPPAAQSAEEEPEEELEEELDEEWVDKPAPAAGRLAWVAGFWARLLAFFIDTLVVTVVVVVMMFISSLVLGHSALEAFDFFFQQLSTLMAAVFVFVLLLLVYLTIFTIFGGQTVGKMLIGLRVVGLDGHSVSTIGALRRALGMLVAGLPGLAGFLWTAFDLKRRGWHDYIGGTLVVQVHPKEMKAALSQG